MYRLILADDEINILEGMEFLINSFDLPITISKTFTNGLDALNYIKENSPDIAVLDINMPKLNGLDLIKDIRKFNKNIEIIIISGYDVFTYAQTAINNGVSAYLLKPIDDEDLYNALSKACLNSNTNLIQKNTENNDTIISFVRDNFLNKDFSVEMVMEKFSRSRSGVYKIFKNSTNMGFLEYITFLKLEYSKTLLLNQNLSIKEISATLLYKDQHHFSKQFKNHFKISPSEFRLQNKV